MTAFLYNSPSPQKRKMLQCHIISPPFLPSVFAQGRFVFSWNCGGFFSFDKTSTSKYSQPLYDSLCRTLATRFCLAFWFQAGEGALLFFRSQILGGDWLTTERSYLLKIGVNLKATTCSPLDRFLSPIHELIILLSVTLESDSPGFLLTWYGSLSTDSIKCFVSTI